MLLFNMNYPNMFSPPPRQQSNGRLLLCRAHLVVVVERIPERYVCLQEASNMEGSSRL